MSLKRFIRIATVLFGFVGVGCDDHPYPRYQPSIVVTQPSGTYYDPPPVQIVAPSYYPPVIRVPGYPTGRRVTERQVTTERVVGPVRTPSLNPSAAQPFNPGAQYAPKVAAPATATLPTGGTLNDRRGMMPGFRTNSPGTASLPVSASPMPPTRPAPAPSMRMPAPAPSAGNPRPTSSWGTPRSSSSGRR